ncbi:MAG: complex I NDUFA9 subunit family protein [Planctomycetes bacterium]|nr:complex I NDUFA9 subunit family protein [Planctomycetota bacterium]
MSETAIDSASAAQTKEEKFLARVVVTGATGFVGRYVVRELVARGHQPVCIVRDVNRLAAQTRDLGVGRVQSVVGGLSDERAVTTAMEGADAVIHIVGIIFEKPLAGQTFHRVHVEGTRRIVEAAKSAGVKRIVHMSALGARPNAPSEYHRTKALAEGIVRESGLDWTIFRPSIIHGHDGEFMRMMRVFVCDAMVSSLGFIPTPFPVIPYFGDGMNRLQPVSVKDVAHCFVAALSKPETIGRAFDLGGPEAVTWKELYRICRETIPGAKKWKPMVSQPVWAARLLASTVMKLPILPAMLRFNSGQVDMSQEDSVCDPAPVEKVFGIRLRDFRRELADYAALIE